ncbi:MAG: tRNA (adenosine(37)-N6)-threonylcarbamoyltransferase complex transferase subunit TsaD [Bacteroidota bacterium]
MEKESLLLAIETSCDETSAAILHGNRVLSNVVSSQLEHEDYGGVIPELASRLHQQHIVRIVEKSLKEAGTKKEDLDAIAFTQGPGLMGALLVGASFAKAMAFGLDIPLIGVNHMQAHVLANFLTENPPSFPFICLTVSGGHTQLVLVKDFLQMEIIGETMDDAAGEAFDKGAKLMGLPYPGGPQIDKLAAKGNPHSFSFPTPEVGTYEFSFSGLKTSLLYQLRDGIKREESFIELHKDDIAASYQFRIVSILLDKLFKAAKDFNVKELAIAGGVSANSELRKRFKARCDENGMIAHIPPFEFCTDNAGMIGFVGQQKLSQGQLAEWEDTPYPRGFQ